MLADSSTDSSVRELEGLNFEFSTKVFPETSSLERKNCQMQLNLDATLPSKMVICKHILQKMCFNDALLMTSCLTSALQKADLLDWRERLVGFGSDGAAVMVGKHGGVAKLLRQDFPHLINIHCLGHGL